MRAATPMTGRAEFAAKAKKSLLGYAARHHA
jgi:hypothetical protein